MFRIPKAEATKDSITFSWEASPSSDVKEYELYVNDSQTPGILASGTLNFTLTSLPESVSQSIKIVTVDTAGNKSSGVTIASNTLIPNPQGLTVEAGTGKAVLIWNPVDSELVKNYNIYVSTRNFSDISALSPRLSVANPPITQSPNQQMATVSGLVNATNYYFAVTSKDIHNGETKTVTTVSAAPVNDTEGPVISNILYNGENPETQHH